MTDQDTATLTIETEDGTSDELEIPTGLLNMLREGEETDPEIVGDIAMIGLAQRIHGAIHHAQGEPGEDVQAAEDVTMDLFEERFGQTFADMTGHDH
ncbi:DUF7545 family protein [Halorientalis regularis]|jgi:hypothetical protein|uniref:Uncharacterized protein n=1 Tax=Halorientalis regularis TaxID=660518 RepID=A0A1G7NUY7_9EURY|nr:hypothetical protein [Halorientalis regularis]SDF77834.1 hypothetical protein SAMN05216218_109154 [Halorientalis regularis]